MRVHAVVGEVLTKRADGSGDAVDAWKVDVGDEQHAHAREFTPPTCPAPPARRRSPPRRAHPRGSAGREPRASRQSVPPAAAVPSPAPESAHSPATRTTRRAGYDRKGSCSDRAAPPPDRSPHE